MANTASQEQAKQFVRLAVHKCGGGIQAEELTNIHASELSRWGNLDGSLHIPFFRMIELDKAVDHAVLKAWARRCGFELITHEQKRELTESVTKLIGHAATENAELQAKALDVIEDGNVTESEYRATVDECREAIAANEHIVEAVGALRLVQ